MSGLFHLVEAATVLTQLGPSTLRPSTAYAASSSSTSPANIHVASISDDDETMANAFTTMAKLRENHLQALCAAAADASSATASTIPAPTSTAYAASTTSLYPTPTTISQRDSGESSSTTTTTREMFPMRLHALLADPSVRDVITWLPHGKSFVVLRPDVFATHVLPRYFAPEGSNSLTAKLPNAVSADGNNNLVTILSNIKGVHKYPSFTRKLNRWGFRQISRGPDSGAFCHDLFQRDDPELCRGMVCQKSRKSKSSSSSSRNSDDMISVSSGSTMETANKSITSIENKRRFSSIVTVSTAGVTSSNNKSSSLPLKKRKSGHHHTTTNTTTDNYMMNGIPSMISHRFQKMSSSSSVTESDLTSENGSVGSNNNNINNNQNIELKSSSNGGGAPNAAHVAETLARETLAHHFHEQRRAFALASLLENSRLAIEAAGMNSNHASFVSDASSLPMVSMQASFNQPTMYYQSSQTIEGVGELANPPSAVGAATAIHSSAECAAPPPISIEMKSEYVPPPTSSSLSAAEAAKIALYKAYLQALTESSSSAP